MDAQKTKRRTLEKSCNLDMFKLSTVAAGAYTLHLVAHMGSCCCASTQVVYTFTTLHVCAIKGFTNLASICMDLYLRTQKAA